MIRLSYFIAFLLLASTSFGQFNNGNQRNNQRNNVRLRTPSLSFGVIVGQPEGQFAANFDGTPAGIGGQFLANMGRSPFEVGAGFNWMSRGSSNEDVWIEVGEDVEGDMIFQEAEMEINSNIYTYYSIGRFKPFAGRIQPYGDVIGGFRNFSTVTVIQPDDEQSEEIRDSYHNDITVVYGWAAGLKIRLTQNILVEGRFSKLQGGSVEFVDRETLQVNDDGDISFDRISSRTDMMNFQLGVSFEF
ncbi:MAG: hypothetical protein MK081_06815 [Flavobacteriales bacterium]|nr:hypothetical protein [Flavobacteriales bacterium]